MKLKLLLNILILIMPGFVYSETVYKSRDAEGNIIFSDVPSEGAEAIEVEKTQNLDIPMPKRFGDRPTTKLSPEEITYTRLEIVSPENNATIRNNAGIVDISVEMQPVLDEKHIVAFLLDGQEVSSGKSLQLSLQELDRGTHSVSVVVKNEQNKVLKRSDNQVFHLHKESVLFRNKKEIENKKPAPASLPVPSL
jgi:uncharacterized protein DUF4124